MNGWCINIKEDNLIGKIFESKNYDKFKVIRKTEQKQFTNYLYEIEFINTKYKLLCRKQKILDGDVKDRYYKSIYGVACVGDTVTVINNKPKKEYNLFCNMLKRCYSKESKDYKNYGAIGVIVHEDWLCFETFEKEIKLLDGYDEWKNCENGEYHLDKDILQENIPLSNKIYSKNTCKFIKCGENSTEVNKRRGRTTLNRKVLFIATHKDGRIVNGCGIYKFANEYDLDAPTISNCLNGKYNNHKGWTFKRIL